MKYKKNEDGTDMLDENGNLIPDEGANEGEENEVSKVNKQLIEELKEMRAINAAYRQELEEKKSTEKPNEQPGVDQEEEKIESVVNKILTKEKSSTAQANKQAAIERFVSENKEFHPDNDIAGLKMSALMKKFNMFNTQELFGLDEFYSVIKDAHRLLVGSDKQPEAQRDINPYSGTPTPTVTPKTRTEESLSNIELKLIADNGWTKEKYLKLKEKHSDMIAGLLSHVRA